MPADKSSSDRPTAAEGLEGGSSADPEVEEIVKFPPEEESSLLKESLDLKAEANSLFVQKDYQNALSRYDDALSSCPNYLSFPRAVLHSNVAACYLSLEQWKDAIKSATKAIQELERSRGTPPSEASDTPPEGDDVEEEIISAGATTSHQIKPQPSPPSDPRHPSAEDILRIRIKSLLRRARAHSSSGGWSNLSAATDDYTLLQTLSTQHAALFGDADLRTLKSQLRTLPARTKEAQEKETAEMWGKLKDLGNGILKPFGLSTNNFQMVKDEKTGGYSMNFDQNPGNKS